MSAGIKKMLAEKAALQKFLHPEWEERGSRPKRMPGATVAMLRIDRAEPFVDASWSGQGWKPSELLKIGFWVIGSGRRPDEALPFVNILLDEARKKYLAGADPNPFAKDRLA